MMTLHRTLPLPLPAPPSMSAALRPTPWPGAAAQPTGHLVCDQRGHVSWADDLARRMLADADVLLLLADGRLGVRSHRLGLLALRSAMRLSVLGTPAVPVTVRHDHHVLHVGVHALPHAADGTTRVLLSLCADDPGAPQRALQPPWRT